MQVVAELGSNRRFFHKRYLHIFTIVMEDGERRMDERQLVSGSQFVCDHAKQGLYTQRSFDILNGFELVVTRCGNCHKILALDVKKLN